MGHKAGAPAGRGGRRRSQTGLQGMGDEAGLRLF